MPGGVDAVTTFMFQLSSKCDVVFFSTGSLELVARKVGSRSLLDLSAASVRDGIKKGTLELSRQHPLPFNFLPWLSFCYNYAFFNHAKPEYISRLCQSKI